MQDNNNNFIICMQYLIIVVITLFMYLCIHPFFKSIFAAGKSQLTFQGNLFSHNKD